MNEDIAWAAGLFEGEGSIFGNGSYPLPRLALAMVDEDVVRRFHAVTGRGTVIRQHSPSMKKRGWQPQWLWRVAGEQAVAVFALLAPWLSERRLSRWDEVWSTWSVYQDEHSKAVTCAVCGDEFFPGASGYRARYCSPTCKASARRAREAPSIVA